jgi:uncharacterized phiE125 gp8 family phage protein
LHLVAIHTCMAYQIITPPPADALAVSIDEVKLSLKIDCDVEDSLISSHIRTAQEYAESFQGRQLLTATYRLYLDEFPETIKIRKLPVQSIVKIEYVNTDGALSLLGSPNYDVDLVSRPSRIVPAYGTCWPSVRPVLNCVHVEFVCGYSSPEAVPYSTKAAILLQVGWLYANREPAPMELDAVNNLLAIDAWGRA